MANATKKTRYTELPDYFPVEIRKALKLGEFADQKKPEKAPQSKTGKAKKSK